MRLWTIHPKYLDGRGLAALWREALLAQAVLAERVRGYGSHPQLVRFRRTGEPLACIAAYLRAVHEEGTRRGYAFDARRIGRGAPVDRLPATRGQIAFEWTHLLGKLRRRSAALYHELKDTGLIEPHPLFRVVPGGIEAWEKGRFAA